MLIARKLLKTAKNLTFSQMVVILISFFNLIANSASSEVWTMNFLIEKNLYKEFYRIIVLHAMCVFYIMLTLICQLLKYCNYCKMCLVKFTKFKSST